MCVSDVVLLARKIAVGIVITIVPLGIVAGSLWLTQQTVNNSQHTVAGSKEASHAN